MKYYSTLPFSALLALSVIALLVHFQVLPSGMVMLESLQNAFSDYFYVMIFGIILLESIVYVGFYFPGQFFAVMLVVLSKPTLSDMLLLTLCMVAAATLGSAINFLLGSYFGDPKSHKQRTGIKSLLLAMIHMNSLAFFMFAQGANDRSMRVVWLAGLLNLPYYLLLIALTAILSEEVMQLAENNWFLFSAISVWLLIAIVLDVRKHKARAATESTEVTEATEG